MSIFAIGDPHLSLGCDKEMNIFNGWHDYVTRLEQNWRENIGPEDTVILAGDISWAMNMEETRADFTFLHKLPGQKYLMKGNHDYWWTTLSSMQRFLDQNGLNTLHFLHNNAVTVEGISLCGSRGWMFEEGERAEGSITAREFGRIRRSLAAAPPENEKILFLHYPPIFGQQVIPEFFDAMKEYGVKQCFYGHLHGGAIPLAYQGDFFGVDCRLISADYLKFCPLKIR